MGGLYGNAAATALEDLPEEARGLMSGILQQGVSDTRHDHSLPGCRTPLTVSSTQYAFGYLLATAFARALVNTTPHGWRPLYWFGACPPLLIILFRLMMGETHAFQAHQRLRQQAARGHTAGGGQGKPSSVSSTFIQEGKVALRRHWAILSYLVALMAGFNFMSHGSQDLYPTMLTSQYGFSPDMVTVTQVVANLGAMTGGTVVGYCSQIVGRRISIIACCILGGALLYPYTFIDNPRIMAAAFFTQFAVQGAWGVIPIHLMELSPGAFRTFVVGTAYQLGNLASSASSTIESRLGERFPLPPSESGESRYDYGKVMCIFMACVFVYVIVLTFFGPEHLRRSFDVEDDSDMREVAGMETLDDGARGRQQGRGVLRDEEAGHQEKAATHHE